MRTLRHIICVFITAVGCFFPFIYGLAAGPIELKMVTFMPDRPPTNIFYHFFVDKVKEASGGQLIVKWVGGPEVLPQPQLAEAVARGVFDISTPMMSFIGKMAPGLHILMETEIYYVEMRKRGVYDFANKLLEPSGLRILAAGVPCPPQTHTAFFLAKKKISSVEELKGMRLACPGELAVPAIKAFGAIPVVTPMPEYFTALERGVVEGCHLGIPGVVEFGLLGAIRYMIDHPFDSSGNYIVINKKRYDSLPENLKDALNKASIALETEGPKMWVEKIVAFAKEKMRDAGIEFIKLPPGEADKLKAIYLSALWRDAIEKHREVSLKLKEMIAPRRELVQTQ